MLRPVPKICFAVAVLVVGTAETAAARWADWPPGPSDAELETIVRVAYTAAAAHARRNTNYFARDDDFAALRVVIEDELGRQGLSFVTVPEAPIADLTAAQACTEDGTQLRFAVNMFGDSITLAAASTKRVFTYHYDPHEDAVIVVTPSQDCLKK